MLFDSGPFEAAIQQCDMEIVKTLKSNAFKKEANQVIRKEIRKALEEADYDVSKEFIRAFIRSCHIKEIDSIDLNTTEEVFFNIVYDFESQDIVTEWETKASEGEIKTASVDSLDIVEFMDKGRPGYTINPTEHHGLLAIGPKGEPYDPDNKQNKIIKGSVKIPPKAASNMFVKADAALQELLDQKKNELLEAHMERSREAIRKVFGI